MKSILILVQNSAIIILRRYKFSRL